MRPTFPTFEQVLELEKLSKHTIPEDWQDMNGHVNIQYYQTLYDMGGWAMFKQLGIDESYFSERRLGLFDLEHHLYYLSELHVGDVVSLHGRFLARNHKRLQGIVFIVNESRGVLACTLEFVSTGANLGTRRSDDFPPDVSAKLDQILAKDSAVSWAAPVCGAMSV